MCKYCLSILLIWEIFAVTSYAVENNNHIKFSSLKAEDGLSSSQVRCVLQDHKGFIWIGTTRGLNRYDGLNIRSWNADSLEKIKINNEYIVSICQVDSSYIFIGSGSGLSIYNYAMDNFIHYQPHVYNPHETSGKAVSAIFVDNDKNIWVGTSNGLCRFQNKIGAEPFIFYPFYDNGTSIKPGSITTINQDSFGTLWIGSRMGLWYYLPEKESFYRCHFDNLPVADSKLQIISSTIDKKGDLILASQVGAFRVTYDQPSLPDISLRNLLSGHEKSNLGITTVHQVSDNAFWLGTFLQGVLVAEYTDNRFQTFNLYTYKHLSNDKYSLTDNHVSSIVSDKSGVVWIATQGGGISIYNKYSYQFCNKQFTEEGNNYMPLTKITALEIDSKGIVWISFTGKGLYFWNPENDIFQQIAHPRFEGSTFYSIEYNQHGKLYGALSSDKNSGLVQIHIDARFYANFDQKYLRIRHFNSTSPRYSNILSSEDGIAVEIVDSSIVWYSNSGGGLFKFDFTHNDQNPIVKEFLHRISIKFLHVDKAGVLWLGNEKLYVLDELSGKFIEKFNWGGVVVCEDNNRTLWIASYLDGLFAYDMDNGSFKNYTTAQGLPSNNITSIFVGENQLLWLGTLRGLSRFNPTTSKITNYTMQDGLVNYEFSISKPAMDLEGNIYFAGTNGIDYFNPDNLIDTTNYNSNVVFTNLAIDGKNILPATEPGSILKENISTASEVTILPHHEQIVISFADLSNTNSEKCLYRYKLEPIEQNWYYTDAKRAMAIYSNLKKGTYTLRVTASNNRYFWPKQEASINLKVLPEYYETWWFRILMVLLAFTLVFLITWYRIRQLKEQHLLLEQKVSERTVELKQANVQLEHQKEQMLEQKDQIHQMKMKFFTNISHEFRTPITLIKGPIEQIIKSGFEQDIMKKYIHVIRRNIDFLLGLVNEIMDFRKLETGHESLKAEKINLHPLVNNTLEAFSEVSQSSEIAINYVWNDQCEIWGDKEKLQKIIYNLISNAFKFTNRQGIIRVGLSYTAAPPNPLLTNVVNLYTSKNPLSKFAELTVEDNGLGISGKSIEGIFDRFYQIENASQHLGSGIGLAITKHLVLLHHGDIIVTSQRDIGTRFTLRFPIGKEHLHPNEIIGEGNHITSPGTGRGMVEENRDPDISNNVNAIPIEDKTILIIEDNYELNDYLKDIFGNYYKVLTAHDGVQGMEKSLKHLPDIILSDVMMPGMSGTQLCKKLKTNVNTSHIPVILLTARTSFEHQLIGLQTGADLYIPKPFDTEMLLLQVKNILMTRQHAIQKIKSHHSLVPEDISSNQIDLDFINKITDLVKANLTDEKFTIEKLASEMFISYKNMQRKLKTLTGYTPAEFVRVIKLNVAVDLVAKTSLPISEVAFQSGFYNSSHFIKTFKAKFGKTPLEYRSTLDKIS